VPAAPPSLQALTVRARRCTGGPVVRALAHIAVSAGRKPRARAIDTLIAATAHAHGVPLYTRDQDDFDVFGSVIEVLVI
jgi:predicted nucleic acid-binding protein